MDKKEAQLVLANLLSEYRKTSYSELRNLIGNPATLEKVAESGKTYQLEIQAFWDDRKDDNLRILGAIDDGGIRAFFPLTEDFIISPGGEFVGE